MSSNKDYKVTEDLCSSRDMTVVDFARFLNRRETTHIIKKKNCRRSEVSNKLMKKNFGAKLDALEDKDVDEYEEDYIPIKFHDTIGKPKHSVNHKKLSIGNINLQTKNNIYNIRETNGMIKFANILTPTKYSSNKSNESKISNYVKEYLSKQLNSDIKNLKDKTKICFEEVSSLLENSKTQLNEKKKLEKDIENRKSYLLDLKEERNKLIAEKHLLKNELDFINSEAKLNKVKVSLNQSLSHYSENDSQQDNQAILASFDKIIDNLEENISNLSVANVSTKEQLENINSEIKRNEKINKVMNNLNQHNKNELAKQDKLIDELIKEKFNLLKNSKYCPKETGLFQPSQDKIAVKK